MSDPLEIIDQIRIELETLKNRICSEEKGFSIDSLIKHVSDRLVSEFNSHSTISYQIPTYVKRAIKEFFELNHA